MTLVNCAEMLNNVLRHCLKISSVFNSWTAKGSSFQREGVVKLKACNNDKMLTVTSHSVVGFSKVQAAQVVALFLLAIIHIGHSHVSDDFWNN